MRSGPQYSLQVNPEGLARVRLECPPGRPLADLVLLSSAHTPTALDELTHLEPVEVRAVDEGLVEISQTARSSVWEHKRGVLRSYPDRLEYWCELRGRGAIEEINFFEAGEPTGGYSGRPLPSGLGRPPRARSGWQASLAYFSTVFNPSPNAAFRQYGWSGERQTIHPASEPTWGGDWFFTPGPFVFGLGDEGRWAMVGVGCRAAEANFYHYDYRGGATWGLALTYQGYTQVDGFWRTPVVVILPAEDEYDGLSTYAAWLEQNAYCAPIADAAEPWWREPIWCGWGEQVAHEGQRPARELSTRANYESWLSLLADHGLVPGTICVDDRWMAQMGKPQPHPDRWPYLCDFIAARQAAAQRVLLWHNAWEWEAGVEGRESGVGSRQSGLALTGARGEAHGRRVGEDREQFIWRGDEPARGHLGGLLLDPTSPVMQERLRELMVRLLAPPPHGLGADGLKVDITQSTPGGHGFCLQGRLWGNALLHRLLSLTYRLAKEANPAAMIECHAANPLFRDTADVLRLNDLHTDLTSVVDMMRHRARVAHTAGFRLVDTDGWPIPSCAALLEYVRMQPEIGIPALYYASRLDVSGEELTDSDYRQIAAVWKRYRGTRGHA